MDRLGAGTADVAHVAHAQVVVLQGREAVVGEEVPDAGRAQRPAEARQVGRGLVAGLLSVATRLPGALSSVTVSSRRSCASGGR